MRKQSVPQHEQPPFRAKIQRLYGELMTILDEHCPTTARVVRYQMCLGKSRGQEAIAGAALPRYFKGSDVHERVCFLTNAITNA